MARRPQGSVRRNPRLKQGKPKPPGVGRPSGKPKKTAGPVDMPKRTKIGKTINPKLGLPQKMPVTRKARGGMLKSIIKIPPLPAPQPMPRSGTISTIDKGIRKPRPAEKFVKIRERINKLGGYAMGGEAREGAARGELKKKRITDRQQELMDMLNRLYGNKKTMERPIMPKDKPKKKPIRPILPKDFKKPKMKRAN